MAAALAWNRWDEQQLWLPVVGSVSAGERRRCHRSQRRTRQRSTWEQLVFPWFADLITRASPTKRCECGRRIEGRWEVACRRCQDLSGRGYIQAEVLHVLLGGPQSEGSILSATDLPRRQVDYALRTLAKRGRVERIETDEEKLWRLRRR